MTRYAWAAPVDHNFPFARVGRPTFTKPDSHRLLRIYPIVYGEVVTEDQLIHQMAYMHYTKQIGSFVTYDPMLSLEVGTPGEKRIRIPRRRPHRLPIHPTNYFAACTRTGTLPLLAPLPVRGRHLFVQCRSHSRVPVDYPQKTSCT